MFTYSLKLLSWIQCTLAIYISFIISLNSPQDRPPHLPPDSCLCALFSINIINLHWNLVGSNYVQVTWVMGNLPVATSPKK